LDSLMRADGPLCATGLAAVVIVTLVACATPRAGDTCDKPSEIAVSDDIENDVAALRAEIRSCTDDADNFHPQFGVKALSTPRTRDLDFVRKYTKLGDAYLKIGDLGAATRSYWATLELVGGTVASRAERERVASNAFEGLQKVAKARNQPQWAALLALCEDLADEYAPYDMRHAEEQKFRQVIIDLQEAEQEVEQAAFEAGQAAREKRNAATGSGTFVETLLSDVATEMEYASNNTEIREKLEAAKLTIGQTGARITTSLAEELPEMAGNKTFVGERVAFYLTSDDPKVILGVLGKHAARNHWNDLIRAIGAAKRAPTLSPQIVANLADGFSKLELAVVKRERVGAPRRPGAAVAERATSDAPFIPAAIPEGWTAKEIRAGRGVNGIEIGRATVDDVVAVFGPQAKKSYDGETLTYDGITFEFDAGLLIKVSASGDFHTPQGVKPFAPNIALESQSKVDDIERELGPCAMTFEGSIRYCSYPALGISFRLFDSADATFINAIVISEPKP
jgi:hypothetical protein